MSHSFKKNLHEGFKDWWQGKDKTIGAKDLDGNYPVTSDPETFSGDAGAALDHFFPEADAANKKMYVDLVAKIDEVSPNTSDQITQKMGFYISRLGPRNTSIRHFIQMLQKVLLTQDPAAFIEWKKGAQAAQGAAQGAATGGPESASKASSGESKAELPIPIRSYSKDERYPEDHPDEKLRGKRKQPLVKLLQDEGVPQVMINTIIRNLAKQFKANNITFTEGISQSLEKLILSESFQVKLSNLLEKKSQKEKKARSGQLNQKAQAQLRKAAKDKVAVGPLPTGTKGEWIVQDASGKRERFQMNSEEYKSRAKKPERRRELALQDAKDWLADQEDFAAKDAATSEKAAASAQRKNARDRFNLRRPAELEAQPVPAPDKSWKPTEGESGDAMGKEGVSDWVKETSKLIEDVLGYSYEVAAPAVKAALTALRDLLLTEINIGRRGGPERRKDPKVRGQLQDWLDWISGPGNPFKLTKSMISGLKSLADSMIEKKLVDSDPITLKNPGNQAEPGKTTPTTRGQSLRELAELAFGKAWDVLSKIEQRLLGQFNDKIKRKELKDEEDISGWLNLQLAGSPELDSSIKEPLSKWGLEQLSGVGAPSAGSDILDMLADPNSEDLDIEEILGEEPNFKGTDPEQQSPGDPSDQEFIEDVKDSADHAWNDAGMRDFYLKSAEKWITLGGTKAAWMNLSRKEKEEWHNSYAGTGLDPRATYMTPYEQLTDGLKASYTKEEWEREIKSVFRQGKSRLRDIIGKVKNRDKSAAAAKQAKEAGIEPESGKIKLSSLNQQLTTISGDELEGVDKLDPTTGKRIPGEKGKGASRAQRSAALKVVQKHIAPYLKARGIPIAESAQLKVADLVLTQYQKFKTRSVIKEHTRGKFNFENASEKIIFEELKKILTNKGYEASVASKIIKDKYGFAV